MRKRRLQAIGVNAAFLAVAALALVILAPQRGQAQPSSAPGSDIGTIDAEPPLMAAGVHNGAPARSTDPFAPTESQDSKTPRGVWYSGYDAVRGAQYVFAGGSVALNGDLSRNGFFMRTYGSWLGYDLDPGDGRGYQADVMLGYRINHDQAFGGIYIGADYQNYRLDPDDPTAKVRGTEWGFKAAADVAAPREETPLYYALAGSYSTSFQTYWARARVGMNLHAVTFGPEAVVLGDVDFQGRRVGGFLIFDLNPFPQMAPIEVGLHVGHQFVAGENGGTAGGVGGGEGTYGGIGFSLLY